MLCSMLCSRIGVPFDFRPAFARVVRHACAAALLSAAAASGAEPELLNAMAGQGGKQRNSTWGKLEVSLRREGGASAPVVIRAGNRPAAPGSGLIFERSAALPRDALLYFGMPAFADRPRGVDEGILAVYDVNLLDEDGLASFQRMKALAMLTSPYHPHLLICDRRGISYNFVSKLRIGEHHHSCARMVAHPADLPERASGYAPFDAVVIGALGENVLSGAQVTALREWLSAGGLLIFTPGPDLRNGPGRPWSAWLPAIYGSGDTVERVPELDVYGSRFAAPEGLRRYAMTRAAGDVLAGTADEPLAVGADANGGRIVALSFDAGNESFQQWDGARAFWNEVLRWPSLLDRYAGRILEKDETVKAVLAQFAGVEVLSRRRATQYLVAVAAVLLASLLVFRRTRRPERGWSVAVALAVLAGAAAVLGARLIKAAPRPSIDEVYVARGNSADATCNAQGVLGLYAPRDTRFPLRGADRHALLRPTETDGASPVVFRVEPVLATDGLPVRADSIRYLTASGRAQAGPLPEVRLRCGEQGLSCDIANPGAGPLEDGFVRVRRFIAPFGDLAGRATLRDLRLKAGRTGAPPLYSRRLVKESLDAWRAQVRRVLFPPDTGAGPELQHLTGLPPLPIENEWRKPMFYYWSDQPALPVATSDTGTARRAMGLWCVRARTEYADGRLLLPAGFLRRVLPDKPAHVQEHHHGALRGRRSARLEAVFSLPEDAPDLEVDGLRVFFAFESDSFDAELLIARQRGGETVFEPLAGGLQREPESPSMCYDPETRSVKLAVDITSSAAAGKAAGPLMAMRQWSIDGLEVELAGDAK